MAEYDGRIQIQTSLDNSEFEAGSDELLKAIKELSQSIETLGNKIESWGSNFQQFARQSTTAVSQTADSLDEAAASADNLRQSAEQAEQAVSSINSGGTGELPELNEKSTADDYAKYNTAKLDELLAKFESVEEEIENDPIDIAVNTEELDEAEQEVQELQQAVQEAMDQEPLVLDTQGIIEPLNEAAEESTTVSERIKSAMQSCFQAVTQGAQEAGSRLKAFLEGGDEQEKKPIEISTEDPIKEIDALDKEMKRLETTANSLAKKDVSKMDSSKLKEYRQQVAETKQKMSELSAEKQRIGQTTYRTEEYKSLEADVKKARDRLAELQTKQDEMKADKVDPGSSRYKILQREIDKTIEKINDLEATKTSLDESGESTVQGVDVSGYAEMSSRLSELKSKMSGIHPLGSRIKSVVGSALKTVAKNAATAAKNLGKMIGGGIISGVKKLGSALKSAAKHAGGSGGSGGGLAGGLKKIVMYGLGVRSVFALVNKLRSALKEGMGNLAAYSDKFNATMSSYSSSMAQLKNSVATAFEPIITAIMPAITALIDGVSAAMTKLAEFFAVMTGQSTYTAAKKYQVDYAKDIAKTTKETDKNTKATKENQKTLAGFDDVEILKENKDSDSDDSSDSGVDPADMFETRAVSDQMKDLLDRLKNMWENADFSQLGFELGSKLLDALNSIPWDQIRETANRLGKSFATLLNGVFSVPGLFYKIGETLAQGLNTLFEFLNGFVTALDWAALGQAVKDGILGFTDNIDWPLIFDTFEKLGTGLGTAISNALDNVEVWTGIMTTVANGLNALMYGMIGFLEAVDWYSLASNIGAGLNAGIEALDWDALARLLSDGINAVARAIDGFISTVDWMAIGQHLGTCVDSVFKQTDWATLEHIVSEGLNSIARLISGFVNTIDWSGVGLQLSTSINNIFYQVDWNLIGQTVCDCFNALIDTLYEFITNLDFSYIGESLGSMISTVINGIDWYKGGYTIGACITGLYQAFNSFMDETDWEGLGRAVIDVLAGFFAGFDWGEVGHSISSFLKACLDFFTGAIQEVDWASLPRDIVQGCGDFLKGFDWAGLAESVGKLIGAAFKALVDLGGSLRNAMLDFGKNIIEGGWQGIKDAISGVGTWIKDNIFTPFVNGFKRAFGIASPSKEMKSMGGYIVDGLLEGIKHPFSSIGNWLKTNVFDKFMTGFKNLFGIHSPSTEMEKEGKYIPEGFNQGVKSGMQKVNSNVKNDVVKPYITALSNAFGIQNGRSSEMLTVGKQNVSGLKHGMQQELNGIQNWVKTNLVDPILTAVRNGFGISGNESSTMKQIGQIVVNSFYQAFTQGTDAVNRWCQNVYQTIQNYFGNNSQTWYNMGQNITIGLNNGMVAQCQTLYKHARQIADNIYNIMRSALDIHSPSVKFREGIGKNIVLGVAEGLNSYADRAVQAIGTLADDLIDEASGVSPELAMEPNLFGMGEVLNGVADRFVLGVEELVAGLERVVESTSFTFPAMATGTVLPYSSAQAPSGSSSDSYSDVGSIAAVNLDGVKPSDLFEAADRIIQAIYANRTQIGTEDLARICMDGMERLTRRYGG